jgi:hypothetical protein
MSGASLASAIKANKVVFFCEQKEAKNVCHFKLSSSLFASGRRPEA